MASVAVAVSGLLGVIIGLILVRLEMNRKKILLVSGLGTSMAFIVLSVSFHVDNLGKQYTFAYQAAIKNLYFEILAINGKSFAGHFDGLTSVRLWTSTVALTMHVMLFNLGYGALVFPIIAEILPIQNR